MSGASAGPLLEVDGLTTSYGSISALRSASLEVRSGEVVGLVGPNGAGKTTLVSTLAGLLAPAAGTVRFDGVDVTGQSPDALLRRGLALVPEHRRLFPDLTVGENMKIGGVTVGAKDRPALIEAIARALMSRPRLLMMDEPSLGLAPVLVDVVFDLIVRLREQGRTLLVVEQNATRMLGIADRAFVLRSGEIVAQGSGQALLQDETLFDMFVGKHR
jgi:branched-chain amino acid transport system ATP-binding protein